MNVKYLAHLAMAGLLVFGTSAVGAENQNQKGNPGQVRSGGNPRVNAGGSPHGNAGGGAKFHAQPGAGVNRGNTARVQNQNRITVRGQNLNRNVTINRNVTRNRAVISNQNNQQNFHKQRIGQNKIHPGEQRRAGGPGEQKRVGGRAVVQISQTQRVHIRDAFRHDRGHFHQVVRVGFPIFVGASVPNDYAFYDMPDDFVEYAPEYQGYKYIVVGDEILIIDPQTWEIVAIIPV
jgi:Protein of unknown function (DUF1236)